MACFLTRFPAMNYDPLPSFFDKVVIKSVQLQGYSSNCFGEGEETGESFTFW